MLKGADCLLDVCSLATGYGKKEVVHGVSLGVRPGEIVAIIGHNGGGKSTLLKAIFGLLPIWKGQVCVDGNVVNYPAPRAMIRVGAAYVPQGNRVFSSLTVRENLEVAGTSLQNREELHDRIDRALRVFPALRPHLRLRAGTLSGGEKQMLALSNALILSPRLLLIDEPSLGLSPSLVAQALGTIRQLADRSQAGVLIVEQKVREVLKIAHCVYVLRNGAVSFSGPAESLTDDNKLRTVYF